jgi:hypothetical protein
MEDLNLIDTAIATELLTKYGSVKKSIEEYTKAKH